MSLKPRQKVVEFFSDFSSNLETVPGRADLARKVNEAAVKESVKNLVMTDRGERLFQPQLGCDIRGSLFENVTPNVVLIIKENIKNTLKTFEPRCIVKDVIIGGNIDRNELSATIVFSVINSNRDSTITIDLGRVR